MKFNIFFKPFTIIFLSLIFIQCKNSNNNYEGEQEDNYFEESGYSYEDGYADGTYCAEIEYYYSETGTSSTYTLEVEIKNNELTMIHWPNGGWLDDSHFSPQDISNGEATFTSDRGVDYTINIIGEGGGCSISSYVTDEDELIQRKEDEERQTEEEEEEEEKREAEEERIGQEE